MNSDDFGGKTIPPDARGPVDIVIVCSLHVLRHSFCSNIHYLKDSKLATTVLMLTVSMPSAVEA